MSKSSNFIYLDSDTPLFSQVISTENNHDVLDRPQEWRILNYLRQNSFKGINRFEADALLNICHLAARIQTLKKEGEIFKTILETAIDMKGCPHRRVARYFLISSSSQVD